MGLFGPTPPKRVTPEEFEKIMSRLYGKLDEAERIEVEKLFRADLNEVGVEQGITQAEFDVAMEWLEEHSRKHVLEDDDIERIKEYFKEHLAD